MLSVNLEGPRLPTLSEISRLSSSQHWKIYNFSNLPSLKLLPYFWTTSVRRLEQPNMRHANSKLVLSQMHLHWRNFDVPQRGSTLLAVTKSKQVAVKRAVTKKTAAYQSSPDYVEIGFEQIALERSCGACFYPSFVFKSIFSNVLNIIHKQKKYQWFFYQCIVTIQRSSSKAAMRPLRPDIICEAPIIFISIYLRKLHEIQLLPAQTRWKASTGLFLNDALKLYNCDKSFLMLTSKGQARIQANKTLKNEELCA